MDAMKIVIWNNWRPVSAKQASADGSAENHDGTFVYEAAIEGCFLQHDLWI
jgi:hypothetical protein